MKEKFARIAVCLLFLSMLTLVFTDQTFAAQPKVHQSYPSCGSGVGGKFQIGGGQIIYTMNISCLGATSSLDIELYYSKCSFFLGTCYSDNGENFVTLCERSNIAFLTCNYTLNVSSGAYYKAIAYGFWPDNQYNRTDSGWQWA